MGLEDGSAGLTRSFPKADRHETTGGMRFLLRHRRFALDPRGLAQVLFFVAFALTSSGCSLVFVTPPSPPSRRDCTTSRLAPVLDSVLAGYQTVRTVHAIAAPDDLYERLGVPREADIAAGASLTALFLGSAVYGYVNTAACERLERQRPVDDFF